MLEYGAAYHRANAEIIRQMEARMPAGAVALAHRMAEELTDEEEDEINGELAER